jgi:PAS domain S-box-containing protein
MAVLKIPRVGTLLPAIGAFALVLIVAFWAAAIMVVGSDRARTLAEVDDTNRNLARTLSEHAARTLDYADRIALQVKSRHEFAGRGSNLSRLIRDGGINRKIVPDIVIVDARGDIAWMDTPMTRKVNLADREHFKVHADADTGKPFVSRPLTTRALKYSNIFFVSRRLNRRDGSFDGIVSVAINPESFTGFYREIGLGDNGLIALTGLDGYVRARGSDSGDAGSGQDVRKGELFQEYGKRDAGVARIRNVVDGVTRRVAFRKLDNYPLVMTVGVAEETVLAAVNLRARTVYVGTALASLLALIAAAALVVMVRRRERDAATLVESEARYRGLLNTLPDAVFLRRDERIVYVNAAALKLLRADSPTQLIGKTTFDILHPDSHDDARDRIGALNRQGRLDGTFDRKYVRLDGTTVEVEISAALIYDNGVATRQVVARDITARKRAEAALYESMERYRRMVEASPDATFINRDDKVIYANPAALQLLGADNLEQLAGRSPLEFVHPDDRAAALKRIEAMDAGRESRGLFEQRFLRLDGATVETELSVSVVVDQGIPARQVVVRDISARKRIEAALRDRDAQYRTFVESSPDAIVIYEEERTVYVNAAAIRMLGADSADQLIGRPLFDLIHPSGHAAALARRAHVLKTGQPTGLFEQTYVRLDGSKVEVEGSVILIPGSPRQQRLVALRDVSARKRAETALRESEMRLRMAVEAASMTNWEWDIASDHTHWGFGHERLLGPLPEDSMKYPDFRAMVHADDRARFLAAGRATIEHGAPYDIEFRMLRTDDTMRWMRHTGRAMRDASGAVEGISGVMQDVTRRHDVERELALSQQRREALMESIPAPAWLKDRGGRFIAVNRAWCQRFNIEPGYAIGRTNLEVFPREYGEKREREDQAVFTSRSEVRGERMVMVDGKAQWMETVKTPIIDAYGEVSGIVGVSYDTTARRQAEERLRASEDRFRQFADAAAQVFWIDELDPIRVVYVNNAFTRIWGVEPAELYANPWRWTEAIHADDRARVKAQFEHWLGDPAVAVYSAEYRIVRPDGGLRWIRDSGTKLHDAQGAVFRLQGIAEDITEQRKAEQALVESQQRRDALLESNPDPSWLKDCDGRYIAANRAWFARHGIAPHNILGKTDRDYFNAERAEAIRDEDRRVVETRAVIRSERNWVYPGQIEWIETVKAPVLDGAGRVVAVVGISHDVTQRKRNAQMMQDMNAALGEKTAELTALNRELESFAYSVSHDLRAPLRHIDGFINLLKAHSGVSFDAQSNRYFERVSNAARRMGRLIDDLLAFSRTGRAELHRQPVMLARLLRETIEHLAPDIRGRRVEWSIGALPEVQGDAGLLAIVFQNLVGNAVKYTRSREIARIDVSASSDDDGMTTIAVRDNGVGFDMKYRHKLFGVFQRLHTDAEFEGTGIGLATVARIVQRHGGSVRAESVEGEGACFFVVLPLARREARAA